MKLNRYLPLLIICIVWSVFASPFLFKHQVPFASTYNVNFFSPWSAYSEFASPVKNDAMPDVIGQIYPWRMFTVETWISGFVPLWNPYSFAGTPHLANYQSAVLSPLNFGFYIFPFIEWWSVLILLQPLLAGLFTYLFVKSLKVSSVSALISAISFMFCGFVVSWMGYGTLVYAILYLPLALLAVEKYMTAQKSRYLVLLSFTIPLSFFSGHFQMSIYFLLFVYLYILFKYLETKKLLSAGFAFLGVGLGILLSCAQLLPSIELYGQSFRSTIFAKTEVIPWAYIPTFLAPDFFGNPVTRNAWFGHYAEWNAYIGLIPLLFAGYALFFIKKNRKILFFTITALLSLLLAFPSPFLDLLVILKIPVLSTSAASRIIVLFSFSAAVLAGFGFNAFYKDIVSNHYKKMLILYSIFIAFFVVLWAIVLLHLFIPLERISVARSNLILPTSMLIFFLLVLIGLFIIKRRTVRLLILGVLVLVICMDLMRFSTKWQSFEPKNLVYPAVPITKFYPQISGYNRVIGNYGAEGSVYYHLPSLEGYDAVYIRRYGQFIASLQNGKLTDSYRSVVDYPYQGAHTLLGANLLGAKYIVHKTSDGQNVWEFPYWRYSPSSLKLLFDDGRYQVLENTNAYPRTFLVNKVVIKKNPQDILDTMFSSKTNLRTTAVVEQSLSNIAPLSSGSAVITSYKPNIIKIKTQSNKQSFLVLTDPYYPGWEARVDGKLTTIYRTDFAFRGIQVPSGAHTVEFIYSPKTFYYGAIIGIIGVIGILSLSILNMKAQGKKKK